MRTSILVDALAERYGSINAASRKADIPLTTLFKLKRENVDLRVSTLEAVARALDRPLQDLIVMMDQEADGVGEPAIRIRQDAQCRGKQPGAKAVGR